MTVWDFFFKREGRISRVSLLIGLLAHNILLMSIIAIYILTRPIFGYFALLIFLPLIISFKFMGVLRTKRLHDVSRTAPLYKPKLKFYFINLGSMCINTLLFKLIANYAVNVPKPASETHTFYAIGIIGLLLFVIVCIQLLILVVHSIVMLARAFWDPLKLHFFAGDPNINEHGSIAPMLPSWITGEKDYSYSTQKSITHTANHFSSKQTLQTSIRQDLARSSFGQRR